MSDLTTPIKDWPQKLSVVIPCYNEEENIEPLYQRLCAVVGDFPCQTEFVFIENGSRDHSREVLTRLAEQDGRLRVLVLSRNFGYQGAISAGLSKVTGDITVVMDGDQQDPPELMPALIAEWRQGFMVVYGTRAKRVASLFYRFGYKLFYRLMRDLSYIEIPLDASDFALMDRRIVDLLNQMPERDRLVRGLRAYTGFRQTGVPYERPARQHGVSSFSLRDYFRFALRSIFSYSYKPLEVLFSAALAIVGLTVLAALGYVILYFVHPDQPRGFSTLILAVLFLGGVQLLATAIIGQYIGRIFEEIKQRPVFILDHEIHHSAAPKTAKPTADDSQV